MAIHFRNQTSSDTKLLQLNGQSIQWSDSVRYLGVTIDAKLKLSKHVQITVTKARRTREALYPMINSQNPLKTRLLIAQLYILPILTYAGPAWSALILEHLWIKLEVVQNITIRTKTASPRFVKNSILLKYTGLQTIRQRIITAT